MNACRQGWWSEGRRGCLCRRVVAWMAVLLVVASAATSPARGEGWRAGVARRNITPAEPLWMAGYGSRDHVAEGKLTDLWAKGLVLEDGRGERLVLVTLDLVGIDRDVSQTITEQLTRECSLPRERVALCCSHTHTGPVVGRTLEPTYPLTPQQHAQVVGYTARVEQEVIAVVREAWGALAPAELRYGSGKVGFAVNRRNNPETEVPARRAAGTLVGPVDHDVPVLAVSSPEGVLRAVVFGYACHATVLPIYEWSGDYPGFAQMALEAGHADCMAMFCAGCGGDQNPLPRRTVELARAYGDELARGVNEVLAGQMIPLPAHSEAQYDEVPLSFARLPERVELEQAAQSDDRFEAARARLLLARWDREGGLAPTYPYPVQRWWLGGQLHWILLGGEVVVDYALRLKTELAGQPVWVTAYVNDVMAYIPSRRVLAEGGYEGGGAMVYYGLPSAWREDVEETIVRAVRAQSTRP